MTDLPSSVTWRGPVAHDELMVLLERTTVAVLPSRAEAFPMFLVEAMARGAIPVATDVGEVARLVGPTGWVVAPGSVAMLTDALGAALSLSARDRHDMGASAQGTRRHPVRTACSP